MSIIGLSSILSFLIFEICVLVFGEVLFEFGSISTDLSKVFDPELIILLSFFVGNATFISPGKPLFFGELTVACLDFFFD